MTKATSQLLSAVLELPREERAAFIDELLARVEEPVDPEWEQSWTEELDRRAAAMDARDTPLPEWSEVRARTLAKLKLAR